MTRHFGVPGALSRLSKHDRSAFAVSDAISEVSVAPDHVALEVLGIGLDQQFVWIEAMTFLRIIRSMNPVAVQQSRPRFGQIGMPDLVRPLAQRDCVALRAGRFESKRHNSTFSALVENTEKLTPSPSQVAPRG